MSFKQEQKWYVEIVQKAWDDAKFKNALITNPIETIESFTGKKLSLPEGKTLVVNDQTSEDAIHINITAKYSDSEELSEAQLEAVAGGIYDPDGNGGCILVPPIRRPSDLILI